MRIQKIGIALLAIILLSIIWIPPAQAQVQGGGWSVPYRLSSEAGASSEGYLAADQYGYVHAFWTELLFENGHTILKYTRFDGTTWTKPNDIYVTSEGIKNVSPFVDKHGTLHIAWSEGVFHPKAYYTHAPANNAISVQNWAKPIEINVPARPVFLRIDSRGVLHILYINQTEESGVYYIRSEDNGLTWSEPFWLDPDIRPSYMPDSLSFGIDENDGLHAVWFYGFNGDREEGGSPDWIRYSHSLDGGHIWSEPFTIDQYIQGSEYSLSSAGPRMIVQGHSVHVIWAAGSLPYRNHRFSTDAGLTWSTPVQILGELHGQAGDGLTVDASGRGHYFAQIRYPLAIWHTFWDQSRWSKPSQVYFIGQDSSAEAMGHRVHAHDTIPVVRAGNQLVLTFADPQSDQNRRLFVTNRTLDDIPPLEIFPTPSLTAPTVSMLSPTPVQPTPIPIQTTTALSLESKNVRPIENTPEPDLAIRAAIIPTLLVLAGVVIARSLLRRRS